MPIALDMQNRGMIPTTIREWLQREPFEPFVIRASSGATVRVASPASRSS